MNYVYMAIVSTITSIITYFVVRSISKKNDIATIEIKRETEIKTESTATSEIKIDGRNLENKLKSEDYDTMVGRL